MPLYPGNYRGQIDAPDIGRPVLDEAGVKVLGTALEMAATSFSGIQPVVSTVLGDGTGIIPSGQLLTVVDVTAGAATEIITLPDPVPGSIVVAYVGANGYELRTADPENIGIGGGTAALAESAIPADSVAMLFCISAVSWVGLTITGITLAAVEAAAAV